MKNIIERIPKEISKDKLRDAARLSIQSAIAAALTFTVMKYFDLPEKFLAILSAVMIVEPSLGNTIENAKGRVIATLVGSGIGFGFVSLMPWGFGTLISLTVTMLIMNSIASYRPNWRYGVVAAVAISLGSENNALNTSLERIIAIVIGISVGLTVAGIVWRQSATSRAKNYIRKALNNVYQRLEVAYENNVSTEKKKSENIANNFHTNLSMAKNAASSIKFGKEDGIYNRIDATEKLYNSVLILNRVGINKDSNVMSEDTGIEQNVEEIKNKARNIIKSFVNKEKIDQEKLQNFEELVKNVEKNVNTSSQDEKQNMYRHSFAFGLSEIKDSLRTLQKSFETK